MWDVVLLGSWQDAEAVIEQHAPHAPINEGLQAVQWEVADEVDGDDAIGDDEAACPLEEASGFAEEEA